MAFSVVSDAPASRDLLDFARYVDPLKSVISNPALDTPFTIGIFGAWGTGKSTLLRLLEKELEDPGPDSPRFVCVRFNPWMYRKECNILMPLLNSLRDALNESPWEQARESGKKMFDVLVRLGADLVLKAVTANQVDLDKLDKLERAYLERKGESDNQLRKLRTTLEAEGQRLKVARVRIVFFIDDLDRCEPLEMIDVLESMKLFLDVENIVHVLALDKEVVDRGVSIRYEKFTFWQNRGATMGAEYLEKMIQMPVYLYPLHSGQIEGYIKALDQSEAVLQQLPLLKSTLSPNPRKIKRALNMLAWTNYLLDTKEDLKGFDRYIMSALAILRVEEPALYQQAAALPSLLVALEQVYAGPTATQKRDVRNANTFIDFGPMAETVRALCETYYKPGGMLTEIFKPKKFEARQAQLSSYISAVGRA